ncbi:MAG: 30S ribosome-binding factor RbfA [Calditrichaeota bacterium]|nr:30S ribosome-binding factor RbfA [Calditrichota bacterium]
MEKIRPKKVADLIKREISSLIPILMRNHSVGFITITHVRMTDDLGIAYVYFTDMAGIEKAKDSLEKLDEALGFIRSKLAKHLHLRIVPNLKFFIDDSLSYANHIETIIKKIHKDDDHH